MGYTLVLKLVLDHMGSNEMALDGRLICKAAQHHLCLPGQCTVRLGLPLPSSAGNAAWQPHVQQAFRQLSYVAKVRSLSTAASSGSEANLELAWGLLRPCLFPGLLQLPDKVPQYYATRWYSSLGLGRDDPGCTAITAGHAHLLPWLVRNCCPVHRENVLNAAAEHLDLEGMKRAVQVLRGGPNPPNEHWLRCSMAKAAARSGDTAIPTLVWLLSARGAGTQQQQQKQQLLLCEAAAGAAESGNLPLLQWLHGQGLHDQGVKTWGIKVMWTALARRHLHVADWVATQEGFPHDWQGQGQGQAWPRDLWVSAALSGSMEPLRWLLRREVPVHGPAIETAAGAGNLEAVQLLHERFGTQLTAKVFARSASSGSVPTTTWLLQAGCPMGPRAYWLAACKGNVDMVLWLAREARCPWEERTLAAVIRHWPYGSKSTAALLPAVRALVEAGCPHGDGTEADSSTWHAAARGDLPLLRYLHEEVGLGFGPGTMAEAAQGGCEAVLEWLVEVGCEPGTEYPYVRAAAHGDLGTLSCLHRLGVPFGDASWWREAIREDCAPLAAYRWMVERGAPWDEEEAKEVVEAARQYILSDKESLAWFMGAIGMNGVV